MNSTLLHCLFEFRHLKLKTEKKIGLHDPKGKI